MFALTWRCDGSEGVKWYLRGIREDGSFYGEIRFQSESPCRRWATFVAGLILPVERDRLAELLEVIRQVPPPAQPGRHFGALFERLSQSDAGQVQRLFEYRCGEEEHCPAARAFLELVGLFEPHLSTSSVL
jgi:hypothetical protein